MELSIHYGNIPLYHGAQYTIWYYHYIMVIYHYIMDLSIQYGITIILWSLVYNMVLPLHYDNIPLYYGP